MTISSCFTILFVIQVLQNLISTYATESCDEANGAVRLVNGNTANAGQTGEDTMIPIAEGRVEMCYNGQWGTVCDDRFGDTEGCVVCRQLGFQGVGEIHSSNAEFGQGTGPIWLDEVDCQGDEATLLDCTSSLTDDRLQNDCQHLEDVAVTCKNNEVCNEGSVQLVNGEGSDIGRLEVCIRDQWNTVCNDDFGLTDGYVVCRQLGFPGVHSILEAAPMFGMGTGPVYSDHLNCLGNEKLILDCKSTLSQTICHHTGDIGIECKSDNDVECTKGMTRLVGGHVANQGVFEVCYNGVWGTVCSDTISISDINVICNGLGLPHDVVEFYVGPSSGLTPGGVANVWNELSCDGSEESVFECSFKSSLDHPGICNSPNACGLFGVMCSNSSAAECVIGSVRLVNGNSTSSVSGRVEVCVNGRWGTICRDSFTPTDGNVVCKQLGFSGVSNIADSAIFGEGSGSIWIDEIDCSGDETSILYCNSSLTRGEDIHNCKHSMDVAVTCLMEPNTSTTATIHQSPTDVNSGEGSSSDMVLVGSIVGVAVVVIVLIVGVICCVGVVVIVVLRKRICKASENRLFEQARTHQLTLLSHSTILSREQANDYVDLRHKGSDISRVFLSCLIQPSDLKILEKIGQGEFGIVYRGLLTQRRSSKRKKTLKSLQVVPVAVKTLKGIYSQTKINELYSEAEKMIHFNHLNVLSLTGICVGLLETPCIVMPFMSNGSLLSYLRKEAPNLTVFESADETLFLDTMKQLLSMCLQVAKGMAYLAEQKFVHRDLAARNCMISSDGIIKVADFGLAEDVYTTDYFKLNGSADPEESVKLPLKWMALESIHFGKFSEKTDVWSYGVLCWEVFSVGRSPYPGMSTFEVVQMLDMGDRLSKPSNPVCNTEIYSIIMLSCWKSSPTKRPCFSVLVERIETLMSPLAEYMDFKLS